MRKKIKNVVFKKNPVKLAINLSDSNLFFEHKLKSSFGGPGPKYHRMHPPGVRAK